MTKRVMESMMGVYEFTIWYDSSDFDYDRLQKRYVVANSEEEALEKLEKYNEERHQEGFAKFQIGRCIVDIQEVII